MNMRSRSSPWRASSLASALLALAGCASLSPPQSAEEFRRSAARALLPRTGTLDVARPLREVAAAFETKAQECLDLTATATIVTITNYQEIIQTFVTTYKPTVVAAPERIELHVQWRTEGEIDLFADPAGGAYRLVVDAYPRDAGHTRLQWFSSTAAEDFLVLAATGWATGQNMACPDFSRNW
jgi:hypothetical protein